MILCSMLGVCALVGLGDELQVSSAPLLRVCCADGGVVGERLVRTNQVANE